MLDMAVAERRLVEAPLGPLPSPFLIDEIASGLLGPVDQTSGAGLYLAYVRHAPSMECSGFCLVLAPSLESAYKHLGSPPGGGSFAIRPLRIRYPGQLVAAGRFFGTRIERATRYSSGVPGQG